MSEVGTNPSGNPTGDPGSGAEPQGNWYDGFSDANKGVVQDRQWSGPEALVESYVNLEKLTGVGPDRLLKLPKSGAAPEEWNPVWERLGRPGTPEGYEFSKDNRDPALLEWAGKAFHKHGLPKSAAEGLLKDYEEFTQQMLDSEEARYSEGVVQQANGLKKEWGAAFDQNVSLAKSAAAKLGMDAYKVDALERILGFDGVMKMFHDIGSRTGESDFVTGGPTPLGVMTPAAAKARISALQGDPDFGRRYIAGDSSARAEMDKLHKWAYPEEV